MKNTLLTADCASRAKARMFWKSVHWMVINKSGSWFSIGDERIGQGRDNAKLYLQEHPDVADRIEQEVRDNMWKLQGSRAKPPIAPAAKAVNVSADDFDDET